MIGLSLLPHPRGRSEWIFVEAPLGVTGGYLAVWDSSRLQGVIYLSRAEYRMMRARYMEESVCMSVATHRNDFLFVPRVLSDDRRTGLTADDLVKFEEFLDRARGSGLKGDHRMEDAAYMICSLMVQWGGEESPEESHLLQAMFRNHIELAT
jgi:hypothetical protein